VIRASAASTTPSQLRIRRVWAIRDHLSGQSGVSETSNLSATPVRSNGLCQIIDVGAAGVRQGLPVGPLIRRCIGALSALESVLQQPLYRLNASLGQASIRACSLARLDVEGETPSCRPPRCWVPELVGAENPVMSCDLHIFVNEAAQSVSSERPDGRPGTWRSGARGRVLMQ
jgi:hypothetical protein